MIDCLQNRGMSAYVEKPSGYVVSLPDRTNPAEEAELPSLEPVSKEIENYFRTAAQIEAALIQERSRNKKLQREVQNVRAQLAKLLEERQRETTHLEDLL